MAVLIRIFLLTVVILGVSTSVMAVDKKLVSTNTFALKVIDSNGAALTGKTLADLNIHYACAGSVDSTIDETGDTLTEIDSTNAPGYYWIATNDSLGCSAEQELLMWATGTGVAPTPRLVKALGGTLGDIETRVKSIRR